MNLDFTFAKESFPLNFHIRDDKIYLCDDIEEDVKLNDNQKRLHENTSYIVDASIAGRKTTIHAGDRHIGTSEAITLNYIEHEIKHCKNHNILKIIQENDVCRITTWYIEYVKSKTVKCFNEIENISDKSFSLEYISSFAKYDFLSYDAYDKTDFYLPNNSWYFEAQWKKFTLEDLGIISPNEIKTFKKFMVSNTGARSTKNYLPCGIFHNRKKNNFIYFQIEANGSWEYEFGDYLKNVTFHLSGPTLEENGWSKILKPGDTFKTVEVALTSSDSMESVLKNITYYRRELLNENIENNTQMVIFNEYMHASWNSPSHQTAVELAPIAKKLGADCFVIDCGWHDEIVDPFYYVGRREESKLKYPEGLKNTLDYICSLGLKVGLWIEMEVVGFLGDAKDEYTSDCFFQRNNEPLVISNRLQLDFRNERVYKTIFNKIDDIITKYELDYLKLDYNIEPGIGTSLNSDSLGDGLLEHNRNYIRLIQALKKKHKNVLFEACASGGNRLDYLTLANADLCSTSDQTDYKLYPYILSNILSVVLPEQAGIWSYPVDSSVDLKNIDNERVIMNMVNSFVGRVHLASKLYLLSKDQQNLIYEALCLYKKFSALRSSSYPYFPIGFSNRNDNVLAFGFRNDTKGIMCLYCMNGIKSTKLNLNDVTSLSLVYPSNADDKWEFKNNVLSFESKKTDVARIFEIEFSKK